MNILTFDIEEWYIEQRYFGNRAWRYRDFDAMLIRLLDLLDRQGVKATFFCLGKIAEKFPNVVKQIASRGHEIGCHSNAHGWLTKMTPEELRVDTQRALTVLEDVSGQQVVSYRAPAFSIGENNKWALDILAECGILHDASIFPASRDFGGFPSFQSDKPCRVVYGNNVINEFPVPTCVILGKSLAYSGGGYFRLLPYGLIKRQIDKTDYTMCYFHLADFLSARRKFMSRRMYETYFNEAGTLKNRASRYVKSNIGSDNAFVKFEKLLSEYRFTGLRDHVGADLPVIKL